MKVQKRGTNVKRHTTHYLVGGKWRTRKESVSLAEKGKIEGVGVCIGSQGKYIKSLSSYGQTLYGLPEVVKK